jgi:hypothetical protein
MAMNPKSILLGRPKPGPKVSPLTDKDKAELVAGARFAMAGTDDGFWADVDAELSAIDEARNIKVDARR